MLAAYNKCQYNTESYFTHFTDSSDEKTPLKSILKNRAVTLFLTTMALLFTLITSPTYAESSTYLNSGLSYINQQNLQSTQTANTSGTVTTDRSGWLLGGRWGWQQLNATGGYSVNAQASMDLGLSGAGDIRAITLNGTWMHALNLDWLTRLNIQVNDYQDDDQPAYNSQTGGGKFTLGWFGKQNSGLDFNAAWQQEQYDDNPGMAYTADRLSFSSRYYFPHQHNSPYWSIHGELSRFDAAEMARYSYDVTRLSLSYNSWHWRKLEGNIQLTWRNNRFDAADTSVGTMNHVDDIITDTGMGNGGMMGTPPPKPDSTQSATQNDTYLTTSLNLRYPLGKQWSVVSNLSRGQYRSNLVDDRPLISGYLGISVKY